MKELFRLKSFQQILFWFFLLGIIIGAVLTAYFMKPEKFSHILIIPSLPALFYIARELYKNIPLLINDFKLIYEKQ